MTTNNFTEAARAEAPPVCEHYWISHSQDSALIPWVIRCGSCGAFNTAEMDRAARAHLAAPDPLTPDDVRRALDVAVKSFATSYPPEDEPYNAWKVRQATWEALRELFPNVPQSAPARPEGAE